MAISCVIPACLNTNIQTPQLQNKPGKRGAEEAPHCAPRPPRAALPCRWQTPWARALPAMGTHQLLVVPIPAPALLCILLLGFLSPSSREAEGELKAAALRGAKIRVGGRALPKRCSPSLCWTQTRLPRAGRRWSQLLCPMAPIISPTLPCTRSFWPAGHP